MFLIVCLGNYEKKYTYNRHNIGFRAGDKIIDEFDLENIGKKFKSIVYSGFIDNKKVLLIKPQTFMNLSGEAVQLISSFFKIPLTNICVIYDDFDIPFGKIRIRKQGSAGTHNGLKSIISILKSKTFTRIRIGIGPKPEFMDTSSFVLSNFTSREEKELPPILENTKNAISTLLQNDIQTTMNQFNRES